MEEEKKGIFKWSFAFTSVIKVFMLVMEDDVMVWFGLLITISSGFCMIKPSVSIPHWRFFQMEQLRLYFVEFGSGIIWALLSVDAVLPWCLSTGRGRQFLYTCFEHFLLAVFGLLYAQMQWIWTALWRHNCRGKSFQLLFLEFCYGESVTWDLVLHSGLFVASLLCWLCHLVSC